MKKKNFLVMVALGIGTMAWAQQQGSSPSSSQQRLPALPQIKASDLAPKIPIVRGIVDNVVDEQRAYILTGEQIEKLKDTASNARKANVSPYPSGQIAKPVSRAYYIDADSAQQTRMIRLSAGIISSFVFSDTNGNPWLIKSVSFDCSLFSDGVTCQNNQQGKSSSPTNILKMQPIQPYAYGNVVVELEESGSPINFMLSTGQSTENDVRIDVRVSGRNPNAKPQIISLDRMPEHDMAMGDFLDGVAPQTAVKLQISGGKAEAWLLNGALYIRTRLSILSPAFTNKVGSADGLNVFKYYSVVPQLLASVNGKTSTLFVSGY